MDKILFATSRNPNDANNPTDFGRDFSSGLSDLRFGTASFKGNKLKGIDVYPDNAKEGSGALFAELKKEMEENQRDTIVFIHGFNVSFEDALKSGHDIAESLEKASSGSYSPQVFVFTWPSDAKMLKYKRDRQDAESAGPGFARGLVKLAKFLEPIARKDGCKQRIHLVAHSMGNYVLRHALQEMKRMSEARLSRMFDEIILVAADEDNDCFEHDYKMEELPLLCKRLNVYFNKGDKALMISDDVKGNPPRLGHDGPRLPHSIPSKVVLIEVDVKGYGLEHSYFADKDVAFDIWNVMSGKSSESIDKRGYVPHANKFKIKD